MAEFEGRSEGNYFRHKTIGSIGVGATLSYFLIRGIEPSALESIGSSDLDSIATVALEYFVASWNVESINNYAQKIHNKILGPGVEETLVDSRPKLRIVGSSLESIEGDSDQFSSNVVSLEDYLTLSEDDPYVA